MRPRQRRSPARRSARAAGQALTEYLLVLGVLVIALLLPLDGPQAQGRCAAVWLADSLRGFYQGLAYFLSLP